MNTAKNIYFWMICSFIIMAAFHAQATTVNYTLDDVILADGEQITGTFDWTYSVGDFEGGSGVFTALDIPYTPYSLAAGNLNIGIQTDAIEISGNGNFHDLGLDITLRLSQPLSPTQSVPIDADPTQSFFECCGNGFKDQPFLGGSIIPSTVLAGDYNFNGVVDAADYTAWRDNLGAPEGTLPNDTDGGEIGQAQYDTWKADFGQTLDMGAAAYLAPGESPGANYPVPEPSAMLLLTITAAVPSARLQRVLTARARRKLRKSRATKWSANPNPTSELTDAAARDL